MRRAFEDDDVSFWEGKFEGRGTTLPEHIEIIDDSAAELEATLPSGEALSRDEREFLDAVGGVRPLQQQALHHRMERVRAQAFTRVRWFSADELTHARAVDLHEPELTAEHREVLRRARLAPMAVLNLRHDRRDEALRRLAVFVRDHQRDEVRYVRVITGKGRQSEGDPVLKPAVVAWASGTGRPWVARWAPETDCSGQWGSVVLQLRARRAH
jgi:DNA-nicking Smr family endonuclease